MSETAYFCHIAERCDYKAWISVNYRDNKVITIISDTVNGIPKIETKEYKSQRIAYRNYLTTLGKVLRGGWKFQRFLFNQ